RFSRDWSSDVCSSDLIWPAPEAARLRLGDERTQLGDPAALEAHDVDARIGDCRAVRTPVGPGPARGNAIALGDQVVDGDPQTGRDRKSGVSGKRARVG